jgi:hypothetical protein
MRQEGGVATPGEGLSEPWFEEKAHAAVRSTERHPGPEWWVLVGRGDSEAKVLVAVGGERVLPVFSGEAEAEMYAWLGGPSGDGLRGRRISVGELVSVLLDPSARVRSVALDPSPEMVETDALGLVSVTRERFLRWVADREQTPPRDRGHATARGGR